MHGLHLDVVIDCRSIHKGGIEAVDGRRRAGRSVCWF
jgi:hypothetical protein